jgi:glutamate dehydrogenase
LLAGECFGIPDAVAALDAAAAPATARLAALLSLRRLQEAASRTLVTEDATQPLAATIEQLRPGIASLIAREAAAVTNTDGLPPQAAALAAAVPRLMAAPAVVRLAQRAGVTTEDASRAWGEIGEAYALDALRSAASAAAVSGPFGPRARLAVIEDLFALQSRLAAALLLGAEPDATRSAAAARLAKEAATTPDLAAVTVATRALASLG